MNNIQHKPIVWTISGADCSGGAGIAADIKTAHSLGVEICHLITANTAQNSQKLVAVNAVETTVLQQQFDCLISDKPPALIKIGLLANTEQIAWLVEVIKRLKYANTHLHVVFDPVGQASVGGKFSSYAPEDLLPLLALTDVLTPNLPEAQYITGFASDDLPKLAKSIVALGVNEVVIKGGHVASFTQQYSQEHCIDYCYSNVTKLAYQLKSPRINTDYSHGGGCSFATALVCFLAHGYLLRDAFTLSKAFIQKGMKDNAGREHYYGAFEQGQWPNDKQYFPVVEAEINQKYQQLASFPELGILRDGSQALGLYPVVDSVDWLKRLMPLGLNIIQLRLKNKTEVALRAQIKEAVELSQQYSCRLFINDYWQLAIEYGAYGVHIGQEDLLDADLEAIQQAGVRLGISTHGCYEFLLAQQLCPSYLAVGAIFPTKTKDMTGQIQGIENLKQMLNLATNIPVVAIGGINLERSNAVWETGTDAIAVVTAITEAENPEQALQSFVKRIS